MSIQSKCVTMPVIVNNAMTAIKLHRSMYTYKDHEKSSHLFITLRNLLKVGKDNELVKKYLEEYTTKSNTTEQAILYILHTLQNVIIYSGNYTHEITRIIIAVGDAIYESGEHINWNTFAFLLRNEITDVAIVAVINELEQYRKSPVQQKLSIRELHRKYTKLETECNFMGTRIPLYQATVNRLTEIINTGMVSTRTLFSDAFLELRTGKPVAKKNIVLSKEMLNDAVKNLELLTILKDNDYFYKLDLDTAARIIEYINMDPSLITDRTIVYLNRELYEYGDGIFRAIALMNRIRRGRGFVPESRTTLLVQMFMNQAFAINVYLSALDLEKFNKSRTDLYVQKFYDVWGIYPPLYEMFKQAKDITDFLTEKHSLVKNLLIEIKKDGRMRAFNQDDFNKFYSESEFSFILDDFKGDFEKSHIITINKPLTSYKQYTHKCQTGRYDIVEYEDRASILLHQTRIIAQFGIYIGDIMQMYSAAKA